MQVKTTRCGKHDHPDFVLEIGEALDTDGRWLVEFLEEAVAEGERFAAGETVAIGWMVARVAEAPGGLLTLHEPDMTSMPIQWIPSVQTTLMHLRIQRAIAESVGLEDEMDFPTIRQSAVVCTDVEDATGLILSRAKPDGGDSGWFIGCTSPTHDHNDAKNLDRTSLYQLALAAPASIGFLSLPAGVQIVARPGAAPHLERNGKRLPIKPRSYLAQKITRAT
jgi:hypothetical protein